MVIVQQHTTAVKKERICKKCKQPGKKFHNLKSYNCTDCVSEVNTQKWAEKKKDREAFGPY